MMYAQKMAVSVKVNGKVLREHGETVALPFGSEYSLSFKNLNSVRALVHVEIDGQDVTDGTKLIVPTNSSIDLERFIKGGNLQAGNRFKFIERSAKIEQHRGVGIEDGLIRVQFEFEREPAPIKDWYYQNYPWYRHHPLYDTYVCPKWTASYGSVGSGTADINYNAASMKLRGVNAASGIVNASLSSIEASNTIAQNAGLNEAGITVPGSESTQQFSVGSSFMTDGVKHVLVLKLVGEVKGKAVIAPVTTKTKLSCSSCGTVNKSNNKFCRECGTAVFII